MTLGEIVKKLGFEVLTGDANLNKEITSGYVSDLLSDVIANIEQDSIWITIQRHINILGVAKLKDVASIIFPRNLTIEEDVIKKAKEEGIVLLRDKRTAFEISGLLYCILQKGN
ncbi:MAG TPA: DRTGG domain-containing protein [Syntrophorhabdaceae bacterium]|nr:DRTGG domain-containing protein [Syntrophorhabdaceae bacterium]HPP06554.1 DRTGG domain-containing protein [Syntrophorhabdaceae bacterium]